MHHHSSPISCRSHKEFEKSFRARQNGPKNQFGGDVIASGKIVSKYGKQVTCGKNNEGHYSTLYSNTLLPIPGTCCFSRSNSIYNEGGCFCLLWETLPYGRNNEIVGKESEERR